VVTTGSHAATVELVELTADELSAAGLVIVLVDHPEFVPSDIAAHARLVLDTKDLLRDCDCTGETL